MWRNRVKFPAPASGPGQVPIIVDICGLKRQIGVPALILPSPSNFPIKWEDRNKLHSLYLFLFPRNSINLIWFSQLTAPTGRNSWNWFYSSHFRVEEAELAWMVSSRARLGSLCLNPTPVRSPAPMIPNPYAPGAMDLLQVSHPPLPPLLPSYESAATIRVSHFYVLELCRMCVLVWKPVKSIYGSNCQFSWVTDI